MSTPDGIIINVSKNQIIKHRKVSPSDNVKFLKNKQSNPTTFSAHSVIFYYKTM